MTMQEDFHIFKGIKRDTHPIKQESQFLWDAHNIRLTTREGDTMLSITNEKSTKELITFNSNETYIGHATIGNYLILFTKDRGEDVIYRIEVSTLSDTPGSNNDKKVILYKGNLDFSTEYPIQAIADYESELVQKVYWVDGKNSPRVINVAKPELLKEAEYNSEKGYSSLYKDAPFNFVQDLELKEEVKIERISSSVGSFPSGVVQYALTYYHKYGQESNIFYTSELFYTAFSDRGGSPEDKISTAFRITLKNNDTNDAIDTKFQYIRVYSIIRTSIDAVPTVKRVTDIDISNYTGGDITIVDNNTTGDIVDPTVLLYVGGKDITASCISSKDNVLFLGDITYNRNSIYNVLKDFINENQLKDNNSTLEVTSESRTIELGTPDSEYNYVNQLSTNTSTFKNHETYRLGCRFQYKNGEWSEPIWIKDHEYNHIPSLNNAGASITLGKMKVTIPNSIITEALRNGYKKAQALIVIPTQKDRTVLAQGILCPTVGQVGNRVTGSGAYAQSSWLIRPWSKVIEGDGYAGAIPACKHDESLAFGIDRCVELQTMAIIAGPEEGDSGNTAAINAGLNFTSSYKELSKATQDSEDFYGSFVVDQQVVTMHSPDIEFGDLASTINSGADLQIVKVGGVHFDSNRGEIDIQTSTPTIDPDAAGFIKRGLSGEGVKSLVSGLFYEDAMVDDTDSATNFAKHMSPRLWMVYMWHRAGSLNNDCVRPEGSGVRTAELRRKSITNLKISNTTKYLETPSNLELLDIKSFNSNELSLTRINKEITVENTTEIKSHAYYGNVDTFIPASMQYSFVCTTSEQAELKNKDLPALSGDAIVGGETKKFSNLKIKADRGTANSVESTEVISGVMPYIVDTYTTSTEDSGEETVTTTSVSGTKTVTVNIADKAKVTINISNGAFSGLVTLTEDALASDSTIVPANYSWTINGTTTYVPQLLKKKRGHLKWGPGRIQWESVGSTFTSNLGYLANPQGQGMEDVGNFVEALKLSREGVRMKYKSAPHAIISLKSPLEYSDEDVGCLHLVEIRQNIDESLRYGGTTKEALMNNLWIPAGPAVTLEGDTTIEFLWGDTWFQRYDFLKTYPFTFEDQNQVTEIGSFFCETRINIDGRYDRNRGSTSFSLSPANFNLYNPVYSQLNSYFNTRMLDDDYYKVNSYPSQLLWTEAKNPSSTQDNWTNLHMANSLDLDGANGKLINVVSLNDLLIGFQEKGLSQILFNSRVQIEASDGVPIEIANSNRVEGIRAYSNVIGCQDKFSMVSTPEGIYFIDNDKHQLYLFSAEGSIQNLGLQLGSLYWPRENYSNMTWRYKPTKAGNNGIRLYYDSKFQDVYFTPGIDYNTDNSYNAREALCFSEQLGQFTSLMSYGGAVMFSMDSEFYSIADSEKDKMTLYKNFGDKSYNNIFGKERPFSFSFISNDSPSITKIFDTIEMRTDSYKDNLLLGDKYSTKVQTGQPFNYIRVDNEYQDTEDVSFNSTNLRKKFRIWRALIPRNAGTRERIRNPWTKITLGHSEPGNNFTILHDLSVKYTI